MKNIEAEGYKFSDEKLKRLKVVRVEVLAGKRGSHQAAYLGFGKFLYQHGRIGEENNKPKTSVEAIINTLQEI